jgi:hypothetical protein
VPSVRDYRLSCSTHHHTSGSRTLLICILLALAMVAGCLMGKQAAYGSTLWSSTVKPGTASFSDGASYELGVKFRSDVSGYVVALRFYKGQSSRGVHVGHLWTTRGSLLSTATFTNESASGWQQVALPKPILINANQVCVASYWDPKGHYALSRPFFTKTYSDPPLYAIANGTDGPNGVFLKGKSGFPTAGNQASNFWVDVVFVPGSGARLWSGSPVPPISTNASAHELGVKFSSAVSGHITALRFYKGPSNTGVHVGHLWTSTGALLATAKFVNESTSGWQQVSLPKSVPIEANRQYVASYWDPKGHFALTRAYFNKPYSNLPLQAPGGGPNGVFAAGTSKFPTASSDASNYWVDVVFLPVASGGSTTTGHLSLAPASLRFGDVKIKSSSTLPFVVTNTGSASATISKVSASGSGFSVSGPKLPVKLSENQKASFSVKFAPAATGSVTGKVTVTSNAANSPATVSLAGTGVKQYFVDLSWHASTSSGVIGYYVYRGTTSGGPYSRLNSSPTAATKYTDTTVEAGQTYYYVATAVNSKGLQSAHSNQIKAVIPSL